MTCEANATFCQPAARPDMHGRSLRSLRSLVDKLPHLLSTSHHPMRKGPSRYELLLLPSRLDGCDGLPRCEHAIEGHLVGNRTQIRPNRRCGAVWEVRTRHLEALRLHHIQQKPRSQKSPGDFKRCKLFPTCPVPSIWAFSDGKNDNMPPRNPKRGARPKKTTRHESKRAPNSRHTDPQGACAGTSRAEPRRF